MLYVLNELDATSSAWPGGSTWPGHQFVERLHAVVAVADELGDARQSDVNQPAVGRSSALESLLVAVPDQSHQPHTISHSHTRRRPVCIQ